ncbi:hypothetical protein KKB55_13690 [Myxococcota bacterium]|nr:hypothetical protein [Myxococcota bacterium]MBU1898787.1 hypothetical protein [Myxococcota bacterium]
MSGDTSWARVGGGALMALGLGLGARALSIAAFAEGALGAAYLASSLTTILLALSPMWGAMGLRGARWGDLGALVSLTALPMLLGWGHAARAGLLFYALLPPLLAAATLIPFTLGHALRPLQATRKGGAGLIALTLWAWQLGLSLLALGGRPDLLAVEGALAALRPLWLVCPAALLIEALADLSSAPSLAALLGAALLCLSPRLTSRP